MPSLTPDAAARMVLDFAKRSARPAVMQKAATRAAMRAVGVLKTATPVDTGLMKRSWSVKRGAKVQVVNDSPYALIIERGSRPHWPPWEPIVRWVARHMRVSLSGADLSKYGAIGGAKRGNRPPEWNRVLAAAWGLCKKIAERGTAPTYFVKKKLPELRRMFAQEIVAVLREMAAER